MGDRDVKNLIAVLRDLAIQEANKQLPDTAERDAFVRDWADVLHHAYFGTPEFRKVLGEVVWPKVRELFGVK